MFKSLPKLPRSVWVLIVFVSLLSLGLIMAIRGTMGSPEDHSLGAIRERGYLKAMIRYNSSDYFIYRGHPMGFQLELLHALADSMGVKLKLITNNDLNRAFEALENGEVDLLAGNLAITQSRRQRIDFTEPWYQSKQVLVQLQPHIKPRQTPYISNISALVKQTVYVASGSVYESQMEALKEQLGDEIHVVTVPDLDDEELIASVSGQQIGLCASTDNIARICQTYFKNIDYSIDLSIEQNIAWGLPKGSDSLRIFLNRWISSFKERDDFTHIYRRYYKYPREHFHTNHNYSTASGHISSFDTILRQYADSIGWDWRLLASLVYQESQFMRGVESHAGAIGLMQMMPAVAQRYGITDASSIHDQIHAGVKYLQVIDQALPDEIKDGERIYFILAAYNAGIGHIKDARRLAKANRLDPNIWFNHVENALHIKSDHSQLNNPLILHGYARSGETYAFVRDIIERFEHYQNLVK